MFNRYFDRSAALLEKHNYVSRLTFKKTALPDSDKNDDQNRFTLSVSQSENDNAVSDVSLKQKFIVVIKRKLAVCNLLYTLIIFELFQTLSNFLERKFFDFETCNVRITRY